MRRLVLLALLALASPAFAQSLPAPDYQTQAADNNTTKAATTAFVLGQAASASPLVNGPVAVGTSTRYARADHVHPTDASRAPTVSPTFTGTPAAPTPAVGTNTTQIATTAFVKAEPVSATQMPAHTGSCTSLLGSVALTCEQDGPGTTSPAGSPTAVGGSTMPTASSGSWRWIKWGTRHYKATITWTVTNAASATAGFLSFPLPSSSVPVIVESCTPLLNSTGGLLVGGTTAVYANTDGKLYIDMATAPIAVAYTSTCTYESTS